MTNKNVIASLILAVGLTASLTGYIAIQMLDNQSHPVMIKRFYDMNEPIVDDGACAQSSTFDLKPVFLEEGVSLNDKGVFMRLDYSQSINGSMTPQWRKIDVSALNDAELALYNKEPMELQPSVDSDVNADWAYDNSTQLIAGVVKTCLTNL